LTSWTRVFKKTKKYKIRKGGDIPFFYICKYRKFMQRKLASIRLVSEINPIQGADAIEKATVDGWNVVVKKNEYKPGDLCVYFEIDSLLPVREEFEFLRKTSFKKNADGKEGFRLRTIKLRSQVSQGLLMPLSILSNEIISSTGLSDLVGTDVTDILGVVKYEPPIPACLAGKVKGQFPSFIPKTDEERIQNLPEILFTNKDEIFYATEKLDGSSTTYYFKDGEFGVCSRNLELIEEEGNTLWKVARSLDVESKLKSTGRNLALQGELIGEGIQGNPYKLIGQTVRFYNAFDIDSYQYFSFEDFRNLISELELESVPIVYEEIKLPETIDQILVMADGKSILNPSFNREGLVFRTRNQRRISFKAISNLFLLSENS
jgi:RNA ligase (TIGR02306 family)